MAVKLRGIIGVLCMLLGLAAAIGASIASMGLMAFDFSVEMSIGELLVQFLPILTGLAALALVVGVVFFFLGNRERSWQISSAGFLLALPTALFVAIFGMIGAAELVALFGTDIGTDPPIGRLLTGILLGVPGMVIAATLFAGLGAFFVSSSVVRESEETFDRNPTRGMNIMDPSVQKELEEARKKHREKQQNG